MVLDDIKWIVVRNPILLLMYPVPVSSRIEGRKMQSKCEPIFVYTHTHSYSKHLSQHSCRFLDLGGTYPLDATNQLGTMNHRTLSCAS